MQPLHCWWAGRGAVTGLGEDAKGLGSTSNTDGSECVLPYHCPFLAKY